MNITNNKVVFGPVAPEKFPFKIQIDFEQKMFKVETENINIEENEKYEQKIFSTMPIVIEKEALNLTLDDNNKLNTYQNINYVIPRKSDNDDIIKYNNISNDYINYIEKINKDYTYGINYVKNPNINFIYCIMFI